LSSSCAIDFLVSAASTPNFSRRVFYFPMTGGEGYLSGEGRSLGTASIEVVADGLLSPHGSGALARTLLGVHVRSACDGGIHNVAVKNIRTIAIAKTSFD